MSNTKPEHPVDNGATKTESTVRDDPLGRILGYLVAIVAILGVPSGLYGYFSGEHVKRVQNTFEFYKDFRSQAFQDKYQSLIDQYDAKADDVDRLMSQYRDNASERDQQVLDVIKGIVDGGDSSKNISSVLFFFDGLAACVNSSLCDNNAAVTLFNLPAREFASAYGPYILYIRDRYKNKKYGTGVFQTRALKTRFSIF